MTKMFPVGNRPGVFTGLHIIQNLIEIFSKARRAKLFDEAYIGAWHTDLFCQIMLFELTNPKIKIMQDFSGEP